MRHYWKVTWIAPAPDRGHEADRLREPTDGQRVCTRVFRCREAAEEQQSRIPGSKLVLWMAGELVEVAT